MINSDISLELLDVVDLVNIFGSNHDDVILSKAKIGNFQKVSLFLQHFLFSGTKTIIVDEYIFNFLQFLLFLLTKIRPKLPLKMVLINKVVSLLSSILANDHLNQQNHQILIVTDNQLNVEEFVGPEDISDITLL